MLVTHFDSAYLEWGLIYLRSVARSCPGEKVFISGVNLSDEDRSRLEAEYSDVVVTSQEITIDGPMTRIDGGGPEARWKVMMQCRVSTVIVEAMEAELDPILIVTNADMLFRRPLDELYGLARQHDLLLHIDDDHLQRDPPQILNTVMVLNTTSPKVREFVRSYDTMHERQLHWYFDQEWLSKTCGLFESDLRVGHLPLEFIDGEMGRNSPIWSAHRGSRSKNLASFRRELGEGGLLQRIARAIRPSRR